jgi:hypothetical protein
MTEMAVEYDCQWCATIISWFIVELGSDTRLIFGIFWVVMVSWITYLFGFMK